MPWLKDKSGALIRVEAITGVWPLEQREDKRDQSKITAVLAQVTTAGGHTHNTSLPFADVVAQLDPDSAPPKT